MPKGKYPIEYFNNPNISKPIEEIYADIDAYSGEFFEDEEFFKDKVDFIIPFPPVYYDGKLVKGLFLSQGVEFLNKLYPDLQELFFSMAYTMWSSYSWSKSADAYLTCYKNEQRDNWFKKTNPDRGDKILIPLQDADFMNEYRIAPVFNVPKDIDILCISRLHDLKNMPLIAKALKIYRQKYNHYIKMTYITGKNFDLNYNGLDDHELGQMKKIENELVNPHDYIEFIPFVNYQKIPEYYTRAKVCIMGSLLEGKNRTIQEAISCNTPAIIFNDFNKYARNGSPAFPEGAGLYTPCFDAESMADTIHLALTNLDEFTPRRKYLEFSGRTNFLNTCIDSFPYYAENLPEYKKGQIHQNIWADMAVYDNYQLSLHDFLYGKNFAIQHVQGLKAIDELLNFFYERFGINK